MTCSESCRPTPRELPARETTVTLVRPAVTFSSRRQSQAFVVVFSKVVHILGNVHHKGIDWIFRSCSTEKQHPDHSMTAVPRQPPALHCPSVFPDQSLGCFIFMLSKWSHVVGALLCLVLSSLLGSLLLPVLVKYLPAPWFICCVINGCLLSF